MEAVHDLPDLLLRWPEMNEAWVEPDFQRFEVTYPERGARPFSSILAHRAPDGWQLRWRRRPTSPAE